MEVFVTLFNTVLSPHWNTEKLVFDEIFRGQKKYSLKDLDNDNVS